MTRKKNRCATHDTIGAVWTPPAAIPADQLAPLSRAFEYAGQVMPPGFIAELEAIAGEYRAFESLRKQEPSPGEKRESVARIASLSRELLQALDALDYDTAESIEDRFALISGDLALRESAREFLGMLAAATDGVSFPKTRGREEAKAIAAVRLWALFDRHGLPFSGYDNNGYGLPGGIAAACLRAVFGSPGMRVGHWLKHALRECAAKN